MHDWTFLHLFDALEHTELVIAGELWRKHQPKQSRPWVCSRTGERLDSLGLLKRILQARGTGLEG